MSSTILVRHPGFTEVLERQWLTYNLDAELGNFLLSFMHWANVC